MRYTVKYNHFLKLWVVYQNGMDYLASDSRVKALKFAAEQNRINIGV